MTRRATMARRLFRVAALLWVGLVPLGQLLHVSYLAPKWRNATWTLSSGALGLFWTGTALWSGSARLGYRGTNARTVYRVTSPTEFWWHVGIGFAVTLVLLIIGMIRLPRLAE